MSGSTTTTTTCIPIETGLLASGLWAILFIGGLIIQQNRNEIRQPSTPAPSITPTPVVTATPVNTVDPPPGIAPPDVPQPGQPGGGGPPSSNPEAATLAPPGTVPIAVFPPFASPRTFPAMCVIFSELTPTEQRTQSFEYGHRQRGLSNIDFLNYNIFRRSETTGV